MTIVTGLIAARMEELVDEVQNSTFVRYTASHNLVLSDKNKVIEMNSASSNDVTIPDEFYVEFDIGTRIYVVQRGAGLTSIAAGGGVTLRSLGGNLDSAGQYSRILLEKVGSNEWYISGDLA